MTEQIEILLPNEDRKLAQLHSSLRCPCGRSAVLFHRGGKYQIQCCTSPEERRAYSYWEIPDTGCQPTTGWHPSSRQAIQIWKAVKVLSK